MTGNLAHLTLAFGLLGNIVSFMVFLAPIIIVFAGIVVLLLAASSFAWLALPLDGLVRVDDGDGWERVDQINFNMAVLIFLERAQAYETLDLLNMKTNKRIGKGSTMASDTIHDTSRDLAADRIGSVILRRFIERDLSVGCFIETLYICFFLFYAPKKARMENLKLIVMLIVVGFGLIVILTQFFASGVNRGVIVGWICLVFSLCVFVAPLGVLRQVIKTRSLEYMPILLSVALTLSAVMWFFYGLLLGDFNIAIPNVLGFLFGIIQMILYFVYKNKKPVTNEKISGFEEKISAIEEQKTQDINEHKFIDVVKLNALISSVNLPEVVNGIKPFL
ncbi:SWEET sugar transporter [Tanacetum coccineum]